MLGSILVLLLGTGETLVNSYLGGRPALSTSTDLIGSEQVGIGIYRRASRECRPTPHRSVSLHRPALRPAESNIIFFRCGPELRAEILSYVVVTWTKRLGRSVPRVFTGRGRGPLVIFTLCVMRRSNLGEGSVVSTFVP